MKLAITITFAALIVAQVDYLGAHCDTEPFRDFGYKLSKIENAPTIRPSSGLNGNWVIYGIPDSR